MKVKSWVNVGLLVGACYVAYRLLSGQAGAAAEIVFSPGDVLTTTSAYPGPPRSFTIVGFKPDRPGFVDVIYKTIDEHGILEMPEVIELDWMRRQLATGHWMHLPKWPE